MIVKKITLIAEISIIFLINVLLGTGPSLQFANGTNTGISSPLSDTISFGASSEERININNTDVTVTATLVALAPLCLTNVFCRQSVQIHSPVTSPTSVTVASGISVLFINSTGANRTVNITLPANPIHGQLLTIMTQSTNRITLRYNAGMGGATVNTTTDITRLDADAPLGANADGASVTYIYLATGNIWQRFRRG